MEYMALSLLIVIMILPLLYILTYRNIHGGRSSSSSGRRLPPSPPSLPVIGHLHLLSAMPHHSLTEIAERLRAPLLYLRLGRVPAVVISSPVLARAALTAHDAALSSRPSLLSARYLSFGPSDVSFSPTGPFHRQIRRIAVSELLSPRRVAAFGPVRLQEIRCLLSALAAASDGAAPLDLSARFFTLAGDVLCRVAFGRRLGSRGKRLPNVFAEALDLFAGFNIGEFFPEVEWAVSHVTGLRRRLERCLAELRAVGDEIIAEHVARARRPRDVAGEDEDEDEDEDFVDALLRVQRSPDLELPITDDNIIALVLDMLVAGIDSTSTTLEWVMTELARHPHIMRKAQEEVGRIVGDKGEVEESDIRQLHYIRAVIKESFRLHPPVPLLLPRESVEPCVLDGYDIPAKTRIVVNAYAIGRDPQTWSKPLEFNPERFDSGAEIDLRGQEFEMLPFGAGRRGCPGYSFALATIEAALASLLYHFDWELPPGVGAADVDMSEIFGLNTKKREPLFLVPKMRRPLSCN